MGEEESALLPDGGAGDPDRKARRMMHAEKYEQGEVAPIPPPMKREITLLAFDPGGTTGYYQASFNVDTGRIVENSDRYGELTGRHHGALYTLLRMTLNAHPNLMVVAEDYRPEFARAQNYVALEYLGVIDAFAQTRMVSFERQGREIKPYWTK